MEIKHDYSYINNTDMLLMNKGYGTMAVHSIHFDRSYTEEQKAENSRFYESVTDDEWAQHCEEIGRLFSKAMNEILNVFKGKYDIHQVSEETSTLKHFSSDWDLFFWSDRGWNGKDYMTHFSLTFNDKRSPEQHMGLLAEILPMVEQMKYENIKCRVQYTAVIDQGKVEEEAKAICEMVLGSFVRYHGMIGKIKVIGENNGLKEYGFFKKRAKTRYYKVSYRDILASEL